MKPSKRRKGETEEHFRQREEYEIWEFNQNRDEKEIKITAIAITKFLLKDTSLRDKLDRDYESAIQKTITRVLEMILE